MNAAFPVQVTFHGLPRSDALDALVKGHVEHLTRFHPRIHGCRVVIEPAEGHARSGGFQLQIRVAIPGNDVVVRHVAEQPHEEAAVTVVEAFRVAERLLEDGQARANDRQRR